MNRWLLKADPDTYGWADLAKVKKERWDGVSNPLALKHLRNVKSGDAVLIYHTGDEKAVVGIAKAVSDAYSDPSDKTGKMAVVDLSTVELLKKPVSLAEIKANKKLADWELVRMSRLSVMPVSAIQWKEVVGV